jgi:hypothetical protein
MLARTSPDDAYAVYEKEIQELEVEAMTVVLIMNFKGRVLSTISASVARFRRPFRP